MKELLPDLATDPAYLAAAIERIARVKYSIMSGIDFTALLMATRVPERLHRNVTGALKELMAPMTRKTLQTVLQASIHIDPAGPPAFVMWCVFYAVQRFPDLFTWVCTRLLSDLLARKPWNTPLIWQGFIKFVRDYERMPEFSAPVTVLLLTSTDGEALQKLLQTDADMLGRLARHFLSMDQQPRMPVQVRRLVLDEVDRLRGVAPASVVAAASASTKSSSDSASAGPSGPSASNSSSSTTTKKRRRRGGRRNN